MNEKTIIMERKVKRHRFDGTEKIRILHFLNRFHEACDLIRVNEGTGRCLLPSFLHGSERDNIQVLLENGIHGTFDRLSNLSNYALLVEYLLHTYF